MLHCSIGRPNHLPTLFSNLRNTYLILTSSSPHPLLIRRSIPYSTWLPRGYATEAFRARDGPGEDAALLPQDRPHDSPPSKFGPNKEANLRLELRWLKDPVALADHSVKLLRKDDHVKALDLVRLASRDVECTVSWNHIIDYEMSKARVNNAIKLYNEMKKRAQLPDAYTFTILFRGLSRHTNIAGSPARALSIYQSMFAENSPVRPSIIHTNAVLKVCALAHDIDALLGIAAELPVRGSGAPDNLSFTIILNAIRSNAVSSTNLRRATSGEELGDQPEKIALAIEQGRWLWLDIRQRWLSGDLGLDEEFVCAMGRLLLLGSEAQNQDDILSLLEQTMDIPRQVGRLAGAGLGRAEDAAGASDDLDLSPSSPANVELETLRSIPGEGEYFSKPPSDPFAPLSKAVRPLQSAVRPSRNTISLILDACIRLKYVRAAQNYWDLLTSPDGSHKVVPDSENYHMYLRLLRLQRSSKLAVELVEEMRSGNLTGTPSTLQFKTFRIALSCCVRDVNNRNSIVYAGKLVGMMMDALPHPDAKALSMYLTVALGQKPRDWRAIMGAIRDTELGVKNLRSLIAYDPAGARQQNQVDILKLVNELIGAIDVVLGLGSEEMKDKEKKWCSEQRFTLAAYVTRMHIVHKRLMRSGSGTVQEHNDEKSTSFDQSRGGRRGSDRSKDHAKGQSVGVKDHWTRLQLERRPRGPARI